MQTFYISEILLLPEIREANLEASDLSLKIQELTNDYLKKRDDFQKVIFFNQDFESFKIEMSRELINETQHSSGFDGQEKRAIVLLNFESAGDPAQNAALKVIEESPKNSLILLPVFNQKNILPTIQSRCLIKKELLEKNNEKKEVTAFSWPKTYSEAIDLAEQYKKKEEALLFLTSLLKNNKISSQKRKNLLTAYQNIDANGNVQLNLEHAFFEKS
jgi:DNA polymerase III delta prime subunit